MRIAYLGRFPFPGSTAATQRVRGVAKALTLAGHDVTIVPMISGDREDAGELTIDCSLARPAISRSADNALEMLFGGGGVVAWLTAHATDVDAGILYGTPAAALLRYLGRSRQRTFNLPPLVLDVVEWYAYSHRPGGAVGPYAAEHAISMNLLAPRVGHAICISTSLATHFAAHGCQTVVVPPLREPIADVNPARLTPGLIHIGYAGSPGAKDGPGLRNLLQAAGALPEQLRSKLQIQIVGLDQRRGEELLGRSSSPQTLNSSLIRWHGRVRTVEAQAIVAACSFTFLQRPAARYAMAGFPTKVVESLALGTPVITNLTSDLGSCVFDGRNGVILDARSEQGASPEAVARALEHVLAPGFRLSLDRSQIQELSNSQFHPMHYAERLDGFLRSVVTASDSA